MSITLTIHISFSQSSNVQKLWMVSLYFYLFYLDQVRYCKKHGAAMTFFRVGLGAPRLNKGIKT
jgi:hypothetical protein